MCFFFKIKQGYEEVGASLIGLAKSGNLESLEPLLNYFIIQLKKKDEKIAELETTVLGLRIKNAMMAEEKRLFQQHFLMYLYNGDMITFDGSHHYEIQIMEICASL